MDAAWSDSLKRAAVKFGIGRYLYRLKSQWVDWDASKRQFVQKPTLPPWALPTTPTKPATNGRPTKNTNVLPVLYAGPSYDAQAEKGRDR